MSNNQSAAPTATGSLDHYKTSRQLDEDTTVLHSLCERLAINASERAAFTRIKDHLLGLSDWHLEQAAKTTRKNQLHKAAEKALKPENSTLKTQHSTLGEAAPDPLIGETVHIITGPWKDHQGKITTLNPDGTYDICIGGDSPFTLKSQTPAIHFGLRIPAASTILYSLF